MWSHQDGGEKTQNTDLKIFPLAELFISPRRDGALGYLLFDRRLVQTCRQFRKLLAYEYGEGWVVWVFLIVIITI